MKNPVLVVTDDKWSRDPYVVFEDDTIIDGCIPDEWIDSALLDAQENDPDITREEVASGMESDFLSDNTDVDEFWPEYQICLASGNYYRYADDGMAKYIDEDEALESMPSVKSQRVMEFETEQAEIAASEITTPRQEGVMEKFGVDDAERQEMADDTSLLRRWNGRLMVFEAQLGEPAQWREFSRLPHQKTGCLKNPTT